MKTLKETVNFLAAEIIETKFRTDMGGGFGRTYVDPACIAILSFVYDCPRTTIEQMIKESVNQKSAGLDKRWDDAIHGVLNFIEL